MATLQAPVTFNGGTNGVQIVAADIGATSVSGAGQVFYANVQSIDNGLSMYLNGMTSPRAYLWVLSSRTSTFISLYFRLPALATETAIIAQIFKASDGGIAAQLGFNSTGQLRIRNGTTQVAANNINANQWYRADWQVTRTGANTGNQTCRVYTGANLHSAVTGNALFTLSGNYTQNEQTNVAFGHIIATTQPFSCFIDRPSINSSSFEAPYSAAAIVGRPVYLRVGGSPVARKVYHRVAGSPVEWHIRRKAVTQAAVDQLLVPSSGAWQGAATTDAAKNYNYTVGLAEYEDSTDGREPDIQHFFQADAWTGPSATQRGLLMRSGKKRSIGLFNWKPWKGATYADIANGQADSRTQAVVNALNAYPYKSFLTIQHEPENDGGFGSGENSPENYVAMFRHIVTRMRSQGAGRAIDGGKIVFVWNMMGYYGHAQWYNRLWPGDDVVDWVGWDPYANRNILSLSAMMNETGNVAGWPGIYVWSTTPHAAPSGGYSFSGTKPIIICEWGLNTSAGGNNGMNDTQAANFFNGAGAQAQSLFPAVKAWVYWNELRDSGFNVRVDTGPLKEAAFSSYVRHPHFNAVSTAQAP